MPDSAVALPVSLSVLVLAWDEAAPAVRTLLDATPADPAHPLLVLLPPAPPAPAPVAAAPEAAVLAPAVALASPTTTFADASQPPAPTAAVVAEEHPAPSPQVAQPQPTAPAAAPASPAPETAVSTVVPQLIWPALTSPVLAAAEMTTPPAPAASPVRIVRLDYTAPLGGRSLMGAFLSPAAPYLGASGPAGAGPAVAATEATATPLPSLEATAQSSPAAAYSSEEEATQAPDLEADLLPLTPAASTPALSTFTGSATPTPLPNDTPATRAALLPADVLADAPAAQSQPAAAPVAAAASTAAVAADVPAVATEATPATTETAVAARVTLEATEALAEYPAPDLNTQVIRYARFGVPAALAEQPFEVIYAPAWPTWLAAAELRQRTGRPLVLHLRALAAGRQPADTAAGWPAEIQRQVLRQADLVLAETYALARRLRRELGLANGAVRVVPAADGAAVARALRRARRR